ncbi:hypothetical protein Tco_1521643, partial [Tanacetum coccineum]
MPPSSSSPPRRHHPSHHRHHGCTTAAARGKGLSGRVATKEVGVSSLTRDSR